MKYSPKRKGLLTWSSKFKSIRPLAKKGGPRKPRKSSCQRVGQTLWLARKRIKIRKNYCWRSLSWSTSSGSCMSSCLIRKKSPKFSSNFSSITSRRSLSKWSTRSSLKKKWSRSISNWNLWPKLIPNHWKILRAPSWGFLNTLKIQRKWSRSKRRSWGSLSIGRLGHRWPALWGNLSKSWRMIAHLETLCGSKVWDWARKSRQALSKYQH